MVKIEPRNEERLIRFLAPEIRTTHIRSRDILRPLETSGIIISLDVKAVGAGGLRLFFQFRDNQDNYLNIFQGVAINAVGTYQYLISPHAVVWPDIPADRVFVSPVPTVVAVNIRHTTPGTAFEYSVHGQFI